MKTWLFALLQSIIASLGLAAYFLADNLILVTLAVLLAGVLGITQPIVAAHQSRRREAYQELQYQNSVQEVDGHLQELLNALIDPPLPHRATVAVGLRARFGEDAPSLLNEYDKVANALAVGDAQLESLVTAFADRVSPWSVGSYLQGLAALAQGQRKLAHQRFVATTENQPSWISPWLGWATAAYQQGSWEEIRQNHPHLGGVELLPYDAGDESTFLELSEDERSALTAQFQQAATSLGNYYAIAEYCRSKDQLAASRDELKKVA